VRQIPATFATSRERKWKGVLSDGIPEAPEGSGERGLSVTFRLAELARKGHPFDVDNLCEPLFAVAVGKKRFFAGRCRPSDNEQSLTRDIVELTGEFGRYGYHRITALLRYQVWRVNHKRVERIWRRGRAESAG